MIQKMNGIHKIIKSIILCTFLQWLKQKTSDKFKHIVLIINILYIIIQDWLRNILFDIWSTEEICRQTSFWFYLVSCSCHISHFLYLFYESFCYLMIQVSFTYREKSTQKGFHIFLYRHTFVRNISYYQSLITALYFWKFALKVKKKQLKWTTFEFARQC